MSVQAQAKVVNLPLKKQHKPKLPKGTTLKSYDQTAKKDLVLAEYHRRKQTGKSAADIAKEFRLKDVHTLYAWETRYRKLAKKARLAGNGKARPVGSLHHLAYSDPTEEVKLCLAEYVLEVYRLTHERKRRK